MPTIRQALESRVSQAITAVTGIEDNAPNVIQASRPEFGDYQANGVMALAKRARTNPRELARQVVDHLEYGDLIHRAEVAGPGFINLFLADRWLGEKAGRTLADPASSIEVATRQQTVVVDYSSPNLAKEMHVGHLRGTIIGDALVRVMQALGHRVIRQNHVGDWGTQFGMLIAHLEDLRQADSEAELSTELSDLETFYRHAKQRFDAEPDFANRARRYVVQLQQGDSQCLAMWEQFIEESLRHCEAVYEMLGVLLTRDDLKAESSYNNELKNIVEVLDEKGLLTESEGAQCVFLDEFVGKDGTPLPAIVQKRDGGFLYATTDLAAVRYRCQTLQADRILYVVDARQSLHFQQVFAIARRAGFAAESCSLEHIAYGTMMGEDGKPFKTRSGDTVKLQDLLEEASERAYRLVSEKNADLDEEERRNIARIVGVSAVKYYDLARNRNSDYVFDWSAMLSFEGNTAPYMLYAYARICSILRKLGEGGTVDTVDEGVAALDWEAPEERALVLKLLQLPEAVQLVAQEGYPNHLCQYLFELAGLFMRFYESCPILKADSERRQQRLALARLSAQSIRKGLELLGIPTLERM